MEEKIVKTFYDITARRWNDIINAVNSRRPADSIEPPLEEHELAEFRKMEAEKAEAECDGGCPLIFDNVEYDYDDSALDIYRTPVSSGINYKDMDRQDMPMNAQNKHIQGTNEYKTYQEKF